MLFACGLLAIFLISPVAGYAQNATSYYQEEQRYIAAQAQSPTQTTLSGGAQQNPYQNYQSAQQNMFVTQSAYSPEPNIASIYSPYAMQSAPAPYYPIYDNTYAVSNIYYMQDNNYRMLQDDSVLHQYLEQSKASLENFNASPAVR